MELISTEISAPEYVPISAWLRFQKRAGFHRNGTPRGWLTWLLLTGGKKAAPRWFFRKLFFKKNQRPRGFFKSLLGNGRWSEPDILYFSKRKSSIFSWLVGFKTLNLSSHFDRAWYKENYATYLRGEDPASHYLNIGAALGFDPGPDFSTSYYIATQSDVHISQINPLCHFEIMGAKEGRAANYIPDNCTDRANQRAQDYGSVYKILEYDAHSRALPSLTSEEIAVHVHLFYTEMAEKITYYLKNIRHPFKLLVSVSLQENPEHWQVYFKRKLDYAVSVTVKSLPNRGRDVAPWVVGFSEEIQQSKIFCHIHTKRSPHNSLLGQWFEYLAHTTLGSVGVVDQILEIFLEDAKVGVVSPCYFSSLARQPNYGKNREVLVSLVKRLGVGELPDVCPDYPAGSFFWARTNVLKPIFDQKFGWEDFQEESGQIDGTTAHAMERLIGVLPVLAGAKLRMVSVDIPSDLIRRIHKDRTELSDTIKVSSEQPQPVHDKVAIYTGAVVSASPMAVARHIDGVDRFFFSSLEESPIPDGYARLVLEPTEVQSMNSVAYAKTHPQRWFKEYDLVIWADQEVYFVGDPQKYIDLLNQNGADCGFFGHSFRGNYIDEARAQFAKGGLKEYDAILRQIDRYSTEPDMLSIPLVDTRFFVYRPQSPRVQEFMSIWWSEINTFKLGDQLSVNYALQKSKLNWINLSPSGTSVRNHPDFFTFEADVTNRSQLIKLVQNSCK